MVGKELRGIIDPKELRLGNLVRDSRGCETRVERIDMTIGKWGVPITEKRLQWAGFERVNPGSANHIGAHMMPYYLKNTVILYFNPDPIGRKEIPVMASIGYSHIAGHGGVGHWVYPGRWIHSMHELQNFYHAITHTELDLLEKAHDWHVGNKEPEKPWVWPRFERMEEVARQAEALKGLPDYGIPDLGKAREEIRRQREAKSTQRMFNGCSMFLATINLDEELRTTHKVIIRTKVAIVHFDHIGCRIDYFDGVRRWIPLREKSAISDFLALNSSRLVEYTLPDQNLHDWNDYTAWGGNP